MCFVDIQLFADIQLFGYGDWLLLKIFYSLYSVYAPYVQKPKGMRKHDKYAWPSLITAR